MELFVLLETMETNEGRVRENTPKIFNRTSVNLPTNRQTRDYNLLYYSSHCNLPKYGHGVLNIRRP